MRSTKDEQGATAVEYGLLVALIAAVIIGTVLVLGSDTTGLYTRVCGPNSPFTC